MQDWIVEDELVLLRVVDLGGQCFLHVSVEMPVVHVAGWREAPLGAEIDVPPFPRRDFFHALTKSDGNVTNFDSASKANDGVSQTGSEMSDDLRESIVTSSKGCTPSFCRQPRLSNVGLLLVEEQHESRVEGVADGGVEAATEGRGIEVVIDEGRLHVVPIVPVPRVLRVVTEPDIPDLLRPSHMFQVSNVIEDQTVISEDEV